jgi:predicted flap endonuclease-1-like 5' DNA nuclease
VIWHIAEVWFALALAFVVGCILGAYLYGLIAVSRLAWVQGAVADQVGDVVDRIKASLGLSPDWRPHVGRSVERVSSSPVVSAAPAEVLVEEIEEAEFEEEAVLAEIEVQPPRAEVAAPPPRPRLQAPAPPVVKALPPAPAPPPIEEVVPPRVVDEERPAAPPATADNVVAMRPAGLSRPRGGVPDNLTRIRGVGERNEARLNSLGIYHFGQIAAWTPGEVRWIGQYLAFPERIERDDWVGQAMILASGGDTGFEKAADRRRRRRREKQQSGGPEQLAADVEAVMGRRRSQPLAATHTDDDEDEDA